MGVLKKNDAGPNRREENPRRAGRDWWERISERIESAVDRGDLTREEADAKYREFRERLGRERGRRDRDRERGDDRPRERDRDRERGDRDKWEGLRERIEGEVERGDITREEADEYVQVRS